MPSFVERKRRLSRGKTGHAVVKNASVVPQPIRLSRRNSRRPLHFAVGLGTPWTRVGVRPVSYSAETWILSNSASYCQTEVCDHGIFGQQQSSTYTAAAPPQANASIPALGLHYGGHGFRDTVKLAGIRARNMPLKLALETTRDMSLLGLDCRASKSSPPEEAGFLEELVDRGLISAAAYSVWLGGPNDEDYGDVLFGAVDHSKYDEGTLWTLRTHKVVASAWGGRYIALSGLNASSPTGSDALMPNGTVVPVQVVFGEWTNVLPSHLAAQMWQAAGANYSLEHNATLIPCERKASAGHFRFQLGGARGPVFRIEMQQLVVPTSLYGEGSAGSIDANGFCEFNLANSSDPADWRLGDGFLRAVYVLFDPRSSRVAVAPLATGGGGGGENIEALARPDGDVSHTTPVLGQPSSLTVPLLPSAPGPTRLRSAHGFQRSAKTRPGSDDPDPGADGAGDAGELATADKATVGVGVTLGALLVLACGLWLRAARHLKRAQIIIEALRTPSQSAPARELQDLGSHPTCELGDSKALDPRELPA